MLRLPQFEYAAPHTIAQALSYLKDGAGEAALVAGGTDLYPNMKRGLLEPRLVVGLSAIPELKGLYRANSGELVIGSCTTLSEVARDARVLASARALAIAALSVSTPALRNMGTLGGNLCLDTRCNYYNQSHLWRQAIGFCMKKDGDICLVAPGSPRCWAISSCDTAPALIALGASARLVGPKGERTVSIESLYRDDGINYLAKEPDEIVAQIIVPSRTDWRSTYWKLRRRGSFDFPVLGVAVAVRTDPSAAVCEAKIVLGGVAARPLTLPSAAHALLGQPLCEETIAGAAEQAYRVAKPVDNSDLTLGYRKRMVRVYLTRALRELAGLGSTATAGGEVGAA
jgi:4-hydroxybenzoyl-CoA reductase subunit beta